MSDTERDPVQEAYRDLVEAAKTGKLDLKRSRRWQTAAVSRGESYGHRDRQRFGSGRSGDLGAGPRHRTGPDRPEGHDRAYARVLRRKRIEERHREHYARRALGDPYFTMLDADPIGLRLIMLQLRHQVDELERRS